MDVRRNNVKDPLRARRSNTAGLVDISMAAHMIYRGTDLLGQVRHGECFIQ